MPLRVRQQPDPGGAGKPCYESTTEPRLEPYGKTQYKASPKTEDQSDG